MARRNFWYNKRVFITGHTGFKGAWLTLWLRKLGAQISGYSLKPPTRPNLFLLAGVGDDVQTTIADIRDAAALKNALNKAQPSIVFHMAAQPIVRESYRDPAGTLSTNVMGTLNLLDAVRNLRGIRAVINVTSDKCYRNQERLHGYREDEPLGGKDPYSCSKACSELISESYQHSFFATPVHGRGKTSLATARAGNVIGGGDWAPDRIIPDCMRALLRHQRICIRNPSAVRPWQHVLDPLSGYLLLAEKLFRHGNEFSGAWNFGPSNKNTVTVGKLVAGLCHNWGGPVKLTLAREKGPDEARLLMLDCSKSRRRLGWRPRWSLDKTLDSIVEWYKAYRDGKNLRSLCLSQIEDYENEAGALP